MNRSAADTVAHQHQHDPAGAVGRCCDNWPPAPRVRTIGSILDRGRLTTAATCTLRLLIALSAVLAVHALLLPATTAWARLHGSTGWVLWLIWAAAGLAAVQHGVLARRPSRTALHALHVIAATAVLMAIAAPIGWVQTLTAIAGAAGAWLAAVYTGRRAPSRR